MRKLFTLLSVLASLFLAVGYSQGQNTMRLQKNKPLSEQLTNPNTVYKIRSTFDLGGSTVTIPNGCTLRFQNGRFANGTVILNGTRLEGTNGLQNVILKGTCVNSVLSSDLFVLDKNGGTDNSVAVQSMFNVGVDSVVFSKGTYSFSGIRVGKVSINANGSTFISTLVEDGYSVINNIFVADGTDYFKLYDATIKGHLEGNPRIQKMVLSPVDLTNVKEVMFKGCSFRELRYGCYKGYADGQYDYRGVSLSCHGCKNVAVENCEFYDLMPAEWIWIAPITQGSWNDVEVVCLRNNYFHNPGHDIERRNTPVNVFSKTVIFEGNLLEFMKYAGSAFNLQSRVVIVRNNVVRNSYFKSIVDVCEYGDFCNDYVEVSKNDFSAYNAQCVVANSKELIVKDNKFEGISAVLAYATYYNPAVNHPACADFATSSATPNQKVVIDGNNINCNHVDTTWVQQGIMVQGKSCSGISIQSLYCNSDSVSIRNNRLYIRDINNEAVPKRNHQPIYIRNAKNITISDNYIDSDVAAIGSKYPGAINVFVYNCRKTPFARLTEVESLNVSNNKYNISTTDSILYTTHIFGDRENTTEWRVKNAEISENTLNDLSKKDQIYTADGCVEKLTVKGGRLDLQNSPAKIRSIRRENH